MSEPASAIGPEPSPAIDSEPASAIDSASLGEVQRLVLSGYDAACARHRLLRIVDPAAVRRFVRALLERDIPTFADRRPDGRAAVDIAFGYPALAALGVADAVLATLADGSPAFAEGAVGRAARRLGDFGAAAAERWPARFRQARQVWIAIHGDSRAAVESREAELAALPGADGLAGWDDAASALPWAEAMRDGFGQRLVHFGFVDGIAQPRITRPESGGDFDLCAPGELLLGHPDRYGVDRWCEAGATPPAVARFLRNGAFGVLRQIAQDEGAFERYLAEQVDALGAAGVRVDTDWLKAKVCGRWPNGAPVRPGESHAPPAAPVAPGPAFDAATDAAGLGCPFGAHVRRANPRDDPLAPPRLRTVFRRGMPYGPRYADAPAAERGLVGVFVGASVEDQFERVLSEWIEKSPMGPPSTGRAKDPLIGRHDEPGAEFHIPLPDGAPPVVLKGLAPFVTTRGTVYAFFPSRSALREIADGPAASAGANASPAPRVTTPGNGDTPVGSSPLEPPDAPPDRYCDIVMEGGITSGIIYAAAVAGLSRRYRFKNIGGSSIGAFAAALTAAAELRRRNGSRDGFDAFDRLPAELAVTDAEGRTVLEQLFVPQPATARLFAIFLATLNRDSGAARVGQAVVAAFRAYRRRVVVAAAVLALVVAPGIVAGLLPCFGFFAGCGGAGVAPSATVLLLALAALPLVAALVVLGSIAVDLAGAVVRNGFGLCRGWQRDADATRIDLAGYLHGALQTVAGRHPLDDPPLTFRDLWLAPGGPPELLGYPATGAAARSIDLQVYASNLSHGRPYRFPLDPREDPKRLYFCADELADYFPAGIVNYLVGVSKPAPPALHGGAACHELPVEGLPIVVAVRLAMSFPLLISAVPLWAVDDEPPRREDRVLRRCWISDGGLCSNFPVHLFDSFLPKWPTFGIALETRSALRPQQAVWLPDRHTQGRGDTWARALTEPRGWGGGLAGFLIAIWTTTWRWNDSTMMRMPAVRDRVVRIFLRPGEGGVNLRMRPAQILALADDYGREAARLFIAKFAEPASPGWTEHRWVRFTTLLAALRDRIDGFGFSARLDRHALPMADCIADAAVHAPLHGSGAVDLPPPSEAPLAPAAVDELQRLLAALESLEAGFAAAGDHPVYDPVPRPALRMRHPT